MKTSRRSLTPIIAASTVGTLIEWYDFYIFGTLATFAAGLLVRPFGALFFGRLGDMIGRKYTFMITLLIMGGSTFAIGLVPAYETIAHVEFAISHSILPTYLPANLPDR